MIDVVGMLNEDWLRVGRWALRTADGDHVVSTLEELRDAIGEDGPATDEEVADFVAGPVVYAMPAALYHKVESEVLYKAVAPEQKMRVLDIQHGAVEMKAMDVAASEIVDAIEAQFVADLEVAFNALGEAAARLYPSASLLPEEAVETIASTAVSQAAPHFSTAFSSAQNEASRRALNVVVSATGADVTSILTPELVQKVQKAHGQRLQSLLPELSIQTRQAIRKAVQEGINSGLGAYESKAKIRDAVAGSGLYPGVAEGSSDAAAVRHRSSVIARTETSWARNNANLTYMNAVPHVEMVYVVDGPDCGWTFHNDPEKANGAHKTFQEAQQHPISHPNCRRSFGPVFAAARIPDPVLPEPVVPEPEPIPEPMAPPAPPPPPKPPPGMGIAEYNKVYKSKVLSKEMEANIKQAVSVLDKTFPNMRFTPNAGPKATFVAKDFAGGVRGMYQPYSNEINGKPLSKEQGNGPQERITYWHEYGHLVDFTQFGGGSAVYGSERLGPSTSTPAFRKVFSALSDTPELKGLQQVAATPGFGQQWAQYASAPLEAWARSFAQYVATVEGDKAALDQLYQEARSHGMKAQWSEKNFKPVKEAFDALFAEQGWR